MTLRWNVIANFLGQGWVTLVNLAFIPLYIRYLGMEAYGLVSFFMVIQAWMTLLDSGLTPALQRETARHRAGARDLQSLRDLLRSLETVYAGMAILVAALAWAAAPWIATAWLKPEALRTQAVIDALRVMGLLLAARIWEQAYRGVILGLQQQVWLNTVAGALATLRAAGAVVVLARVSPDVRTFFAWQALVSVATILLYARKTYGWLGPAARGGRFSIEVLRGVGGFAGGMALTTLLALLLTQADKVLVSTLLPLDVFSTYMLAATVAAGLNLLVTPVSTALYPRLTELVARNETERLADTYREACQWLSAALIPAALVLAVLARPLLRIWTGDEVIAANAAPLVTLLALGTLCNGLVTLPYMLQLAHGWTGFAVRVNVVAAALVVPALLWAVPRYGAAGGAAVWLALNAGYVVISIHWMHRRLLPAEKWPWYRDAIALPLAAGGAAAGVVARVLPPLDAVPGVLVALVLAALLIGAATTLALPVPRRKILGWLGYNRAAHLTRP